MIRRAAPRAAWLVGPLLLTVLLVPVLTGGLREVSHGDRFLPAQIGNQVLDGAEPGAVVLLAGDSWAFPALYARYWEGRRQDLEVRPLYFLDSAVLDGLAQRGFTEGSGVLLAGHSKGSLPPSSRPEHLLELLVEKALPSHPVQVNEAFMPSSLDAKRRPVGLLYVFDAGGSGAESSAEDALWDDSLGPLREDPRYGSDPFGPASLARRYASRGGFHLLRGEAEAGLLSYQRASRLATDPWDLVHLLRSRLESEPGRAESLARPTLGLRAAEEAFLAGDVEGATTQLRIVLGQDSGHPRALLLAERLYTLGQRADRQESP